MTYYLLLKGDTEKDVMFETNVLGELFCFKKHTVSNGSDDQLISNLTNVIKNLNLAFPEMNYEAIRKVLQRKFDPKK